jgi:predicted permease
MRNFLMRVAREPAFAAIFVITLALGVGANLTLLSALSGYYFAPLPYRDSTDLAVVRQHSIIGGGMSNATYRYVMQHNRAITAGGLAEDGSTSVVVGGMTRTVSFTSVTASLFKTLGVKPFIGQTLNAAADKPNAPHQAVLSYSFWRHAFDADPNIVGKVLRIGDQETTIVGVMPQGFYFPTRDTSFYLPRVVAPASLDPKNALNTQGSERFVVRVKPGLTTEALDTALEYTRQSMNDWLPAHTAANAKRMNVQLSAKSLRASLVGDAGKRLILIELAAALLFALTCAILAGLVLMRRLAHGHETALRVALGGGRFTLLREALSSTLPLGVIAGAVSVGLTYGGTALISHYGIGTSVTAFSIQPGPWIVLLTFGVACTAGAIAALPAAFASRKRLLERLSEGQGGGISRKMRGLQRAFPVMQIALAVALLANAGLLGIGFHQLVSRQSGFSKEHLYTAILRLHGSRFGKGESAVRLGRRLAEDVRALPGIEHAGVSTMLPFGNSINITTIHQHHSGSTTRTTFYESFADAGSFKALGMRLMAGRLFHPQPASTKPRAAVIDIPLARKLYGSARQAIGQPLLGSDIRVVGVVQPVRWEAHANSETMGSVWFPYDSAASHGGAFETVQLAVRTMAQPPVVRRQLKTVLRKLASAQAFVSIKSMPMRLSQAYRGDQAPLVLFVVFGLLALVLAGVGVYGTVSYLTRLRLREFAIRQVLGATPNRVAARALSQGLALALAGVVIGVVGGILLARALAGLTGLVHWALPWAYIVAAIVMILIALGATAIPALRARRADLTSLLRPQ